MAKLPDSAVALIEGGAHGHLVTINPDGSPQVSMVWVGVDDDELCIAALTPRKKMRNIERDPRVALTFESAQDDRNLPGGTGLRYYLAVHGTARITVGGAPALLRKLAPAFVGPDVKFPRSDNPPEGWVMRITPERWHGHGPWIT